VDALRLIMDNAYFRYDRVLTAVPYGWLMDLAVACHKYDCVHTIKNKAGGWLEDFNPVPGHAEDL
jgi:hypothetical protein